MADDNPEQSTPRSEALAWWKGRVDAGQYVGPKSELPSPPALRVLRAEALIEETLGGWGWVLLGRERPNGAEALRHNYWPLVGVLLAEYEPAEIYRISAVRLHSGDTTVPAELYVRHRANRSRYAVTLADDANVMLTPDENPASESIQLEIAGIMLPVSTPERTLVSLPLSDVREHRDPVLAWLRSLVVARPALEAAYASNPRHVLVARLGHLAQDLGNRRLAEQIEQVLAAHHAHHVSRTDTGVGSEILVPAYVTSRESTRDPGLDRLQARLAHAAEVVHAHVAETESGIERLGEDAVLGRARAAKLEDTYHSTTIEGYHITREEVQAVVEGRPHQGRTPDEIERLMALQGYSRAFDRTLALVRNALPGDGATLGESLILDLHIELWGPSIDAGIVSAANLRGWRERPAFIRGSRHVPPAPTKVGRYMSQLVDQVNDLEVGPLTRAILTHWGFVHIHPFMDGNGRLARLLMNYQLAGAGLPWTTIRAEQRVAYFAALERAHIEDDLVALAEFLRTDVERAARSR